jgi:hypothetical protein
MLSEYFLHAGRCFALYTRVFYKYVSVPSVLCGTGFLGIYIYLEGVVGVYHRGCRVQGCRWLFAFDVCISDYQINMGGMD